MSSFVKPEIKYTNPEVKAEEISKGLAEAAVVKSDAAEDLVIAQKLVDHLDLIRQFNEKNDAINYLIDNAKTLADGLSFETKDPDVLAAIKEIGGTGNIVDINLFDIALNIMDETFDQMALASLTGYWKERR